MNARHLSELAVYNKNERLPEVAQGFWRCEFYLHALYLARYWLQKLD